MISVGGVQSRVVLSRVIDPLQCRRALAPIQSTRCTRRDILAVFPENGNMIPKVKTPWRQCAFFRIKWEFAR